MTDDFKIHRERLYFKPGWEPVSFPLTEVEEKEILGRCVVPNPRDAWVLQQHLRALRRNSPQLQRLRYEMSRLTPGQQDSG